MFEIFFGIHEQALLLHGTTHRHIGHQSGQRDTPNYKARDIDFSAVLANTGESAPLPMQINRAAHITVNDAELPSGELKYRQSVSGFTLDGNTVEMPVEQAAFSENNVRYQASLTFINSKIAELQLAIAGQ